VANGTGTGILHEFFRLGFYKRNQGRIARLATFYALAAIVALGCWKLGEYSKQHGGGLAFQIYIPLVILVVGIWASFRVVQMPAFADFLISVEGEMNKVSWPSRAELFRASLVVILVIFSLAAILYFYDLALTWFLKFLDSVVGWLFD
jgi:preprotein translocase subunit SecE